MYLLQQMRIDSTAYNMPQYFPIDYISLDEIQEAADILITRHESFRTLFVLVDDIPKQKILEHIEFTIDKYEISDMSELKSLYHDFVTPFDLSIAPLFRVAYVKNRNTNESYLLTDMHHIISDGVSIDILIIFSRLETDWL